MNWQKLNDVETYTNLWNNFKELFKKKKKKQLDEPSEEIMDKEAVTESEEQDTPTEDDSKQDVAGKKRQRETTNRQTDNNGKKSHEIDVLMLAWEVLKNWKSLLAFFIIFAALGVYVALNTPKSYTSQVILAPEASAGMGLSGGLADMASSFGINLDKSASVDAIYPELYPDVLSSTDFITKLFDVPVRLQDNDTIRTYKYHLTKDYVVKESFIAEVTKWLSDKIGGKKITEPTGLGGGTENRLVMSKDDADLCEGIKALMACIVDKKTSVITISVQDRDPLVAAIMADTIQVRLQKYITNYRTKKSHNDYEYYMKLCDESKEKYLKAQRAYAKFSDENTDAELQTVQSKRDELENEMQLRYNVYTQMQAQAQQAQARILERTPAFTIIENPKMSYKPSSTPRSLIVIGFVFFGIVLDSLWVLFRQWKRNRKNA